MSWVFVGTDFFSPKSSNAKNSTLGTSEADFGDKKTAYNTQGSTVLSFTPFFLFCYKVCHQPSFMCRLTRASIIMHRAAHAYTNSRLMACDAG